MDDVSKLHGDFLVTVRILIGDVREKLKELHDESVHCVVTSPPYWGLRCYGVDGQIGQEKTYQEHVEIIADIFDEVKRVLRKDGTLWLNYGDSYNANQGKGFDTNQNGGERKRLAASPKLSRSGLKPKDLCGIPWRVAFALQERGWYLRQDIIWAKPNPMPESVKDRCTKAHEYIFLLSKSSRYFFDAEAIAEDTEFPIGSREDVPQGGFNGKTSGQAQKAFRAIRNTRNKRSVWEIATSPFPESHFATFPPELPEICIKAGTSEKGCCGKCGKPWMRVVERTAMVIDRSERTHDKGQTRSSGTMLTQPTSRTLGWSPSCQCTADVIPCMVLDIFGGAGTTGLVADRLQRNAILIELNPTYAAMAEKRIHGDAPMFAQVAAQ